MACLLFGANMDHQVVVMCLPEKELTILREDKSQKLLVTVGGYKSHMGWWNSGNFREAEVGPVFSKMQ